MKKEKNMKNITEIGRFKLAPIVKINPTNLKFIEMPTEYGLNLEAKTDSDHYYVIATIKGNRIEEDAYMETVGTRFIDEVKTAKDWKIVRSLLKVGSELVIASIPRADY